MKIILLKIRTKLTNFIFRKILNKYYSYFTYNSIVKYIVYNNMVFIHYIQNDINDIQFNIIKELCWLFRIYTYNSYIDDFSKYNESIVVDNFSEFIYENNIECDIYDNSNKWCGCTNDKLKEIKMFCKLNNCTYKIIKD